MESYKYTNKQSVKETDLIQYHPVCPVKFNLIELNNILEAKGIPRKDFPYEVCRYIFNAFIHMESSWYASREIPLEVADFFGFLHDAEGIKGHYCDTKSPLENSVSWVMMLKPANGYFSIESRLRFAGDSSKLNLSEPKSLLKTTDIVRETFTGTVYPLLKLLENEEHFDRLLDKLEKELTFEFEKSQNCVKKRVTLGHKDISKVKPVDIVRPELIYNLGFKKIKGIVNSRKNNKKKTLCVVLDTSLSMSYYNTKFRVLQMYLYSLLRSKKIDVLVYHEVSSMESQEKRYTKGEKFGREILTQSLVFTKGEFSYSERSNKILSELPENAKCLLFSDFEDEIIPKGYSDRVKCVSPIKSASKQIISI